MSSSNQFTTASSAVGLSVAPSLGPSFSWTHSGHIVGGPTFGGGSPAFAAACAESPIVQAIDAIGGPDRAGAESGPPLAASNMTNICVNGGTDADIFYDNAVRFLRLIREESSIAV